MKRSISAGRCSWQGAGITLFSDDELERIHLATLEVMETAGLRFMCEEALDIFEGAGAKVDRKNQKVYIPPDIVEECISSAPRYVRFGARDPKRDVILDSNRVHFCIFGEGVQVVDRETGEVRPSTKQDEIDAARLTDALEAYDICAFACLPHDVDHRCFSLHNYEAMISNTTKHCTQAPQSTANARDLLEMAAVVAGGKDKLRERQFASATVCPTSPLSFSSACCEGIIEYAKAGLPMNILSMAMAGGSSPVTLAGTLVTHNAEVLGGICLAQLTRKGAPVIYGSATTILDLRKATATVGCPELALISAAAASLTQRYLIPSCVAGSSADSKVSDMQAGHEKTMTALLPALAGANMIYGLGMVDMGMTLDFGQIVADNEFALMIKRILQGIAVGDEELAVDLIKSVGAGGNFLTEEHTMKYMRREQSYPKLIDRNVYAHWKDAGATDYTYRVNEEAKRILETHQPEPLPDDTAKMLREIIIEAEKREGVR